jgi:hypothetical protein
MQKKRASRWSLTLPFAAAILAFGFFIMPFEPVGRPLSVAGGKLACGEVQLTQTFTGSTDPYFVLFYFRPAGEKDWLEYYVDDESPYWRGSIRVTPDEDSCVVTFYSSADLSFSCSDRRLQRRHRQATFPRATVANPLSRDYRAAVGPQPN